MKIKRGVFNFKTPICVSGYSAVVGEMEGKGPLKDEFDRVLKGDMFGEKGKMFRSDTWIDIDTGASGGGSPMLLRLDDLKAFYCE